MNQINFLNFNKIQNLKPLSFTSNPIKPQAIEQDTFTRTGETSKKEDELSKTKQKIEDEKSAIAKKELELAKAKEEYQKALEEENEARKMCANKPSKEHEKHGAKTFKNLISKRKAMFEVRDAIARARVHLKKLEDYLSEVEADPNIAFLKNPDLTREEKEKLLNESSTVVSMVKLADQLQVPAKITQGWHKAGCFQDITITSLTKSYNGTYIDTENENNKEFLEEVSSGLKTAVTGDVFAYRFNTNEEKLRTAFQDGQIKALGLKGVERGVGPYSMIFDLEDETNKQFIENLQKTTPSISKFYNQLGKKGGLIPANHLQELGFCDIKTLKEHIKSGKVKGTIQKIETPQGTKTKTLMDVSNANRAYVVLTTLRDNNPDTISAKDLAKELHIKQSRIKTALEEDELEIIKTFLFYDDSKTLYFKRSNPKNAAFINKVMFENMLADELKAQHRLEVKEKHIQDLQGYSKMQSLRMSLAWSMCPNTRQIASSLAKDDGYLCSLLVKENESTEELSAKEQAKVNSYRKEMWSKAGTDEFKTAIKKAQEYIELYLKEGFEGIDDINIRRIIMEYNA